ncbi:MAG: hypothetical protein QM308_09325 [Bacillota bacterium]|nr:hypothetical protein [Bacillota bacterium]
MKIDLSCPVELWHFKLPTENYPVVRLNLFNLADKAVTSLQAALFCFDKDDQQFARQVERVNGLSGEPRSAFEVLIASDDGHLASRMDFIIEKVWFEDGTVWRRGTGEMSEYKDNRLEPSRQLDLLRQLAGHDALGYPSDQGAVWVCLCGRPNAASATVCQRCGREKREQFTTYHKAAIETLIYKMDAELEEKAQAARLEAGRMQEEREKKELRRKKRIRRSVAALVTLVLLGAGAFAFVNYGLPAWHYYQAEQALNNNQYDLAKERFLALEDYRDASDMAKEADYRKAARFMDNGNVTAIKSAEDLFSSLLDYKDSRDRFSAARYRRAGLLVSGADYAQAIELYDSLSGYEDSLERSRAAQYAWAKKQMEELDYVSAREKLLALSDYQDAKTLAEDCLYLPALSHMANGEFEQAEQLLLQLPERQTAQLKLQETYYLWGEALFKAQDFENAAQKFLAAGDYMDAFRRASECLYEPALKMLADEEYEKAKAFLDQILAYRDSALLSQQASYNLGLAENEKEDYVKAAEYLEQAPDVPEAVDLLRSVHYHLGEAALEQEEFAQAAEYFTQAGEYEDASDKAQKARFDAGVSFLNQKDYAAAAAMFTLIPDYPGAQEELLDAQYNQAITLLDQNENEKAYEAFLALGDYSQSVDYKNKARYQQATALLDQKELEQAALMFSELEDYMDAASRAQEAWHGLALSALNAGDMDKAIEYLGKARGFGNANELYLSAVYQKAAAEEAAGNQGEAAKLYALIPEYQDAAAKSADNYTNYYQSAYTLAKEGMKKKDYKAVIDALTGLDLTDPGENYQDIPDMYHEAVYQYAEQLYNDQKPYEALVYYKMIPEYKDVTSRKLTRAAYRIIGAWETQKGARFVFREDGTATVLGKDMYYFARQYLVRVGLKPDEWNTDYTIVSMRGDTLTLRNTKTRVQYKCTRVE